MLFFFKTGLYFTAFMHVRRVWRYQRGNQNPYIDEGQTTQWPKKKDKQRSTKHTHKTNDRVARTPLKPGGEHRCSGRVNSSFSTNGTRRANLVTNPVISHEWGKDREVVTTSSGISYQLRDICSMCRCCWNVATYKCKVHNWKIEIISFVVKFRS